MRRTTSSARRPPGSAQPSAAFFVSPALELELSDEDDEDDSEDDEPLSFDGCFDFRP